MRKYADLKEPLPREDGDPIVRIMLYEAEEGTYLFEYDAADALQCCADLLYASAEEACEEWNALIDESGHAESGCVFEIQLLSVLVTKISRDYQEYLACKSAVLAYDILYSVKPLTVGGACYQQN